MSDHGPVVRRAALALALFGVACSAPGPARDEHFAARTLTITADGILPAPAASLPVFGVLVFRNATAAPIEIRVQAPFPPCAQCSTVLGFQDEAGHGVARSVPAQGVASLCFHDAGRFPFVVKTAAGERTGSVAVGGS